MGKIFVGGKEFNPPPSSPSTIEENKPKSPSRKLSRKEIIILISVILTLLILGWLPTQLIYKFKISKLEQKIEQLDPLNKIEIDLKYKLSKLEKYSG